MAHLWRIWLSCPQVMVPAAAELTILHCQLQPTLGVAAGELTSDTTPPPPPPACAWPLPVT